MSDDQSVLTMQKNLPISGFRKLNLWIWSCPWVTFTSAAANIVNATGVVWWNLAHEQQWHQDCIGDPETSSWTLPQAQSTLWLPFADMPSTVLNDTVARMQAVHVVVI